MANIQNELNNIKNAVFGKDVRDSIHDAIKTCYDDASVNDNANMEVKLARGVYKTLNERLNESDKKQEEISSQLEHKANEDEVRKKSVLITETDISDRLKQQINGNAPIMQTIGNKSVTKEKTTFYKNGKNLFNKDAVINGYYINHTNGDILINSIYSTSDYISIDANENYTLSNSQNFRYALYDSEYNFIKGAISSRILTDENSCYIRFSFTGGANNPQLEKGSEASAYEEYYSIIPFTDIEKHSHSINELEGQIREDNTIFFNKSDNLVNKNTCISGFISSSNGELYSHSTYWCTDFIEVETGEYSLTGGLDMTHAACYDINKTYICPVSDFKITSTTINITNDNVKFIRLLVTDKSKLDTIFLYKGLEEKIYTEFGYFLKDEYIKKTDSKSIIINLPSKLYALEGEEFNIYFDNILEGRDTDYIINVDCNVGMQLERCYRLVPTQKGKVDITINVYDKEMNIVGVKTSKIIISSKTQGSGLTKKVIILGDSTTNNGICVTKLNENFSNDEMSITTLGTRGVSPYNHEGRSGWTFRQYFTMQEDTNGNGVVNPFYNPNTKTFDYEYYCNNSGIETTDYFIINLGINDTFNYSSDSSLYTEMENLFAYANEIIRQIHTKDANIKIGIVLTIPPNYSQDAFGKAYNCNQYRDRYKRNNVLWVNELIKKYDNRENENIYLIPLHCNLDTKYNFGLEEIQVNKRNNMTYLSPIGNGGVHPVDSGYWQCADTYWYFLKAQEL